MNKSVFVSQISKLYYIMCIISGRVIEKFG